MASGPVAGSARAAGGAVISGAVAGGAAISGAVAGGAAGKVPEGASEVAGDIVAGLPPADIGAAS